MSVQKKIFFSGIIKASHIGKGGAYIEFPFDVEEVFGKKGRVKIQCSIEGEAYRGSLVKMGTPCYIIGILKNIREKIGKQIGDNVSVVVWEDTEDRIVEIPEVLLQVFRKDKLLKEKFEHLSYTRRKELALLIETAKKSETRQSRLEKIIKELKAK